MKGSSRLVVFFSAIGSYAANFNDKRRARMRRKFDACYIMAQESLPFLEVPSFIGTGSSPWRRLGFCVQYPGFSKTVHFLHSQIPASHLSRLSISVLL